MPPETKTPARPEIEDRDLMPQFSWWRARDTEAVMVIVSVYSLDGSLISASMLEQPKEVPFTIKGPDLKAAIVAGRLKRIG